MKAKILVKQKEDGTFEADRPERPGSPIIGRGKTWTEAVGNMVIHDPDFFNVEVKVEYKKGRPFRFRPRNHR